MANPNLFFFSNYRVKLNGPNDLKLFEAKKFAKLWISSGHFPSQGCAGSHQQTGDDTHYFTDSIEDDLWYLEDEVVGRKLMSGDNDFFA